MTDDSDFDTFVKTQEGVMLRMLPPPPPTINYYLALLDGLMSTYLMAAGRARAMKKYDEGMYYQGKADATREAITHYRELKP